MILLSEETILQSFGVSHAHCPEGHDHPQPQVGWPEYCLDREPGYYCALCLLRGRLTEMVECEC